MTPTRAAVLAAFAAASLFAQAAQACMPAMPEPPLAGESPDAYKVRVEALERDRTAQYRKQRQADALQRADVIFIARDIGYWSPPYRPPPVRRGMRPLPPRPLPLIPFPAPSWFRPIAWLQGSPSRMPVRIETHQTSCGFMSFGDTTHSEMGNLYVFFARKGPLSEKSLIDAIAIDTIVDPALLAFVAKYRGRK